MLVHWRKEFNEALPDEGTELPEDTAEQICLKIPEGKSPRDMTREEIQENHEEVRQAKVKEINGLYEIGCSKRWPIIWFHNIIDARWVITWKIIEGNVGVKCRLTARGFKDRFQDSDTYAGATSRSGQRFVNGIAAENTEFILFSLNVRQAFATGLLLKELDELIGTEIRAVELDVPKPEFDCLRAITGFEIFDPAIEILVVIKQMYGLKGAPRAWRKKPQQVLEVWMSCQQLHVEPEFYCVRSIKDDHKTGAISRANGHDAEQR